MIGFGRMSILMLAAMGATAAIAQQPATGTTQAQFQETRAARMMAADADKDGKISKAEWDARATKARSGAKAVAGKAFGRMDANGDGYADRSEIDAMMAQRFARMDRDKSGTLATDEMGRARGAASAMMDE